MLQAGAQARTCPHNKRCAELMIFRGVGPHCACRRTPQSHHGLAHSQGVRYGSGAFPEAASLNTIYIRRYGALLLDREFAPNLSSEPNRSGFAVSRPVLSAKTEVVYLKSPSNFGLLQCISFLSLKRVGGGMGRICSLDPGEVVGVNRTQAGEVAPMPCRAHRVLTAIPGSQTPRQAPCKCCHIHRGRQPFPVDPPPLGHYLWFAFVCFLIRSHPP